VEAEGTERAVLELLERFGDPARGGFLRSATVRDKGARSTVSAATGVLDSLPAGLLPVPAKCSGAPEPGLNEPPPAPTRPPATPGAGRTRRPTPPVKPPDLQIGTPEPAEAAPFTLVAFLVSQGKTRVSLRVGDQVRVVAVGDQVEGWRCVSIDRDEGAVFTSALRGRLVLKAGPQDR
jgi:hypothetical protein